MSYNNGKNMVNGCKHGMNTTPSSTQRQLPNLDQNMPGVLRTSHIHECRNVAKLKLSEKLKVLLENGDSGCKEDPYAFSEIDAQLSAPLSQALNSVESYIRKNISPTSISFTNNVNPLFIEDCNDEAVATFGNVMPVASQTKVPRTPPQPRSMKLIPSQVSYVNKNTNKQVKQRQGMTNARSGDRKSKAGKPLMNQVHKAASAMMNQVHKPPMMNQVHKPPMMNQVHKSPMMSQVHKAPLMNQVHKAAMMRNISKPRKPAPIRSMSLDGDLVKGPLNNKMSILGESLLEMKCQGPSLNIARAMKNIAASTSLANSAAGSRHDALQRIWSVRNKMKELRRDYLHFGLTIADVTAQEDVSTSECLLFQNQWFSPCSDFNSLYCQGRRRDVKLSQLKVQLRHKIKQLQWNYKDEFRDKMVDLVVSGARKQPNLMAFMLGLDTSQHTMRSKVKSSVSACCDYSEPGAECCGAWTLPYARFCRDHIVYCSEQQLFTKCCALRSDNSSCNAPALDKTAETPLCLRHQKPKMTAISTLSSKLVSKTPQARKRSRSTPGSTRSGRSRKRKRLNKEKKEEYLHTAVDTSTKMYFGVKGHVLDEAGVNTTHTTQIISKSDVDESQEVEVGEEVLTLPLDGVELANQATRLLEEHDLTNVLNHIPADAFNDLFTEDKEEYEPTPQETEELERALEAVDKDVKSLEKLSETQGILESLLDEQTIVQTLAQLPTADVAPVLYHNGYTTLHQLERLEDTLHGVSKTLSPHTVLLSTDHIPYHAVSSQQS